MRQKHEELEQELELLKQKYAELEKLAKGRVIAGIVNFKRADSETGKASRAA